MAENMSTGDGGKKLTNEQVATQGAKELVEATKQTLVAQQGETQEQRATLTEQARRVEDEAYRKLAAVHSGAAQSLVSAERAKIAGDADLKGAVRFDEDKHQTGVESNAARALAAAQGQRADVAAPAIEQKAGNNRTAIEGAKELAAAKEVDLSASYSDDGPTRRSEQAAARRMEDEAYKKLASVDAERAAVLVAAEREKRATDQQLQATIQLDPAMHHAAREAARVSAVEQPAEAKREREPARELVEQITKQLEQPQHRFELHDPSADTTRRFQTAAAATATAEAMGASRMVHREADGSAKQVDKVDGQWYVRNEQTAPQNREQPPGPADKPLASVQEAIDRDALRGIEARAELRAAANSVEAETDRQLATADALAFRRIAERATQQSAAVEMANNARTLPEYKVGLDNAIRGYPGTAEKVYELDAANTAKAPATTIDADALARVAANRARDAKQAAGELGLNGIEPAVERKQQQKLEGEEEAKRAAWVKKAEAAQPDQPKTSSTRAPGDNQVSSDEAFNATKADIKPIVPVEVENKYLRVGDKYYHPKNTDVVAFEDKGNKLETRSNSEQIAETMVTIARARGWDEIKVSGTETFRKEVWLEAAAHGMQVKGYTPSEIDKAELGKRTREVEANKVEPDAKFRARENDADSAKQPAAAKQNVEPEARQPAAAKSTEAERSAQAQPADADRTQADQLAKNRAQAFANKPPVDAVKEHPELAGTYAAMASMEKKAQADNLTPQQQAVVTQRIRQNIVNSIERGELPQVQVREQAEVKREVKEEREMSR